VAVLLAASGFGQRLCGLVQERQFSAIGFLQVVLCEDIFGGPTGDDAHVQHDQFVEVVPHGLQVMVNDKYRAPTLNQFLQNGNDGTFRAGVDASEGLIHEIDFGILSQRACEKDALLLAAG